MARAILYDSTLCVGCRACEDACAKRWGNPYNETIAAEERLSEHKLTTIITRGERYSRRMCNHCVDPSCASACPVAAMQKTELGPVVYHADRCMGCRYCMVACPFGVPAYEWSSRLPKVRKCDQCYERQAAGKPTTCTEACPTNATICGDRDEMIAEARRRIAAEPGKYYGRVYGVREVGGTSLLTISAVPFEQIGMKTDVPTEQLPMYTWRVLELIPGVASVGATLLGGVWWITHRREQVTAAEGGRQVNGTKGEQ